MVAAVAGLGGSGSTCPPYVSAGHLASLGDAVAATCVHRTPETIRQADIRLREGARPWAAELESDSVTLFNLFLHNGSVFFEFSHTQ